MAVDLFRDFATDLTAEEKVVWVDYAEDVAFLIARANNKKYNRLMTKAFEKNKRLIDAKTDASEAKAEEIIIDTAAQALLLGWRGNLMWQGQPMEYSITNARTMLAIKDFRRWVFEVAEDVDRFKVEQKAEDAGK